MASGHGRRVGVVAPLEQWLEVRRRRAGRLVRVIHRRAGHQRATRRHSPTRRRKAVAVARHDHEVGVGDGHLDARLPVSRHEGATKERVQHSRDVLGSAGARAKERTHRGAATRRWRGRDGLFAGRQYQTRPTLASQGLERGSRGIATVHHDRPDRGARGRLDRSLPPTLHFNQIEERAQHPVHVTDEGSTTRARKFIEGSRQCLGSRVGPSGHVRRRPQRLVGVGAGQLGRLGLAVRRRASGAGLLVIVLRRPVQDRGRLAPGDGLLSSNDDVVLARHRTLFVLADGAQRALQQHHADPRGGQGGFVGLTRGRTPCAEVMFFGEGYILSSRLERGAFEGDSTVVERQFLQISS